MQARLSAFVVWALVGAGVAFWGLRLIARPDVLPAHTQTVDPRQVAGGDFVRLFGAAQVVESAAAAPVAQDSRFKLLGVLAPAGQVVGGLDSSGGVALIAVDGKPARPYAVGAALDGDLTLQSVARRSASIGPAGGAASVVLELPPPVAPATGTLPVATAEPVPALSAPHAAALAGAAAAQAPVPHVGHDQGARSPALR